MKKILCLVLAVSMLLCISVSASALTVTSGQVDALRATYSASQDAVATDIDISEATYGNGKVSVTFSSEKLAGITDAQTTILVFDAQKPEGSEEDVAPAAGNILAIDQFTYDADSLTYEALVTAPEGAELVVMMGGTDINVASSKAVAAGTVTPPTPSYVKGDATGNNSIDVFDAVAVLQHVAAGGSGTLTGANLAAADYTENGTIDVFDAVAILQSLS